MPSCALLADVYARADGKSDHIEDIRSHRISLVYAPDVVSAVLACINTGPPTYGQAMHIAQIEAPTIAEYYQIVADALNSLREEGKVPGLKGAEKKRKQRSTKASGGDDASFAFDFGANATQFSLASLLF